MILANMTTDGSGQSTEKEGQTDRSPTPFYRRSLFWLLIGLLVGVALLFILHSCQPKEEQSPESKAPPAEQSREDKDGPYRDLLELHQAQNKGLEEEIRRLQQLLQEDPCSLPELIGTRPDQSPVAPGYVQAQPSPKNIPNQAGGSGDSAPSPGAAAPQPGSGNATVPQQGSANATAPERGAPGSTAPQQSPETAPQADQRTAETVGELLDRATVFIISQYNGQGSMGSGFFVAPGIIATNSHVVQGSTAKVIVGNKALGGMHEARILAFSEDAKRDYALLKISDSLASKAPALMISKGAKRMEKVSAWGFPGYIAEIDPKLRALAQGDNQAVPEVVYSEGVVSVVLDRSPPVILHTASISQGNSGGPLVNAQGIVVGINTFIKQANKSYSQTNIALIGEDLAKYISEQGIQAYMAQE